MHNLKDVVMTILKIEDSSRTADERQEYNNVSQESSSRLLAVMRRNNLYY